MTDCVCSDSCTSGIVGGPGCTSEPAHRSLAEAAFGPVTLSPAECAAFEMWLQRCTSEPAPNGGYRPPYLAARAQSSRRLTERDAAFLFPGHRPALRIVRGERGDAHRDFGDEDDGRGGGAR